jgi:FkbM family methyltransferase
MISYAQNFEDVLLNRLFPENHKGFYIDVGACHPTAGSVTAHFYLNGWSGINVEPSYSYLHFRRERPRDVNLQLALSNRAGSAEFHEFPNMLGVSSFNRDIASLAGTEFRTRTVEVSTLAEICDRHARRPIDFVSIDVEGHEREVLEGADFARFRPRALVIEATHPHTGAPAHENWEHLLLSADYVFACFDGLNRYYVRSEDRDLIPRLAVPPNVFDNFTSHSLYVSQVEAQELKLRLDTLDQIGPVSAAVARRLNRLEQRLPALSNMLLKVRRKLGAT